jgi:hypothetical protein
MEFEAGQSSEQDAGDVVQEAAERALVELVNVRHMEVKRLERELEELRTHCEHLFQSFSVPTFPPGNSCHIPSSCGNKFMTEDVVLHTFHRFHFLPRS